MNMEIYCPRRSRGQYSEYITRAKALPILSEAVAKDTTGNAEACMILSSMNTAANEILIDI